VSRGIRKHIQSAFVAAAALMAATLGWPSISIAGSRAVLRSSSSSGSNGTTYHGNAEATGVVAPDATLLPSRPAWTSPVLDGQLYGEPLVADGRVVAATENDTVYASRDFRRR
jgi:outer membrane protein assembly factor BamB